MNKAQLIDAIASGASMTKADAGKTLGALTSSIEKALKSGERVSISGFGTFFVTLRKARLGRNPRTGEAINIAEKKVVKYKPSSGFVFPSKV